jgi:hypothetical protein
MLSAITKADFRRRVKDATAQFRANWDGCTTKIKDTSCSDTLEAIKDVIADSNMKYDLKRTVNKALGLVLDAVADKAETEPDREWVMQHEFLKFVPYAAVVVTRNRNHHAYNIGYTYIMVHGEPGKDSEMFGMDKKGCIINKSASAKDGLSHLPRLRRSIRPATEWEIERFIDALYA